MDKKKVIELTEDTILMVDTIEGFDDGDTEQLLSVRHKLNEALDELQKPDWISVEDELPPIGERVWVCNIKKPDVVVSDYRSDTHNCNVYDGYGFFIGNHATHWRKIDKLEV